MAKSNWKGTSGWGAINDPTGVLHGRVLVASAGMTATNEDYLMTVVGTSTQFSANHYSIHMDYAFTNYNETHPFSSGTLGLIARAGNFQGSPESAYDCYLGQLNVEEKAVKIVKRISNEETTLLKADLPNTALSRGAKHTMEFRCYGTEQTTLQLLLDGALVANVGDISADRLLSGYSGIQAKNGTAYVDTYTLAQYTSDGDSPSLWTPNQITGVTVAAWYIGNEGVTVTGTTVTGWADQSANSNNLLPIGTSYPEILENDINNLDALHFDGSTMYLSAVHHSSLDFNTDGTSIFAVISPKSFASAGIVGKENTYEFYTNTTAGYKYSDGTSSVNPVSFAGATDVYQITSVITNDGLFVDGDNVADVTFGAGTDNTNELKVGKDPIALGSYFSGNIAEIIVIKGECNQEQRELIEGYLAQKYATWTRLPANHPYRNYAPIVQE